MGDRAVDHRGSVGFTVNPRTEPGPLWLLITLLLAAISNGSTALAQEPPHPATTATAEVPIERQPYRILLNLVCSPGARMDEAGRAGLLSDWQVLVRSYVGAPWVVSIAPESSPNGRLEPRTLKPDMLTKIDGFDKVWLIHLDRPGHGSDLQITGREYDAATRQFSPLLSRTLATSADAARALFRFTLDLFNPTALINGQAGGRALLSVRGMAIEPASPIGAVVKKGTVFAPLRLLEDKGKVKVLRIVFTYLQVEAIEGTVARCAIISGFRDPLTQRMLIPNTLAAVGLKPGNSPLRLRFETKTPQLTRQGEPRRPPIIAPAAGYLLTARSLPDGQPRELGLTDRAGRIVLQPGFAEGLVMLRLLAGNIEPMVDIAMMPGESDDERLIPFSPRPETVALEAELESLRDEVLDLVALRKRLEARMKARLEGEDWNGLQAAIREYGKLTPREELAKRFTTLKDDAAKRNVESRVGVLTKTAQAQLNDLQSMIDAYLEDDTLRAYVESVDRNRAEKLAASKGKSAEGGKASSAERKSEVVPIGGRQAPAPATAAPSPTVKKKATGGGMPF